MRGPPQDTWCDRTPMPPQRTDAADAFDANKVRVRPLSRPAAASARSVGGFLARWMVGLPPPPVQAAG